VCPVLTTLGAGIAKQGYNASIARYVLVQLPLDPTKRAAIIKHNTDAWERNKMLPKVFEHLVEYTCLGGNHFTIFCRMVLQLIRYLGSQQEKGFCSDASGALSVNVLADIDKHMAAAVRDGGQYIVLSRRIYDEGDEALAVIQRAENLINAIRTNESELQLMRRCCRVALDSPKILAEGLEKLVDVVHVDFPQIPRDHACKAAMFALHMGGLSRSTGGSSPAAGGSSPVAGASPAAGVGAGRALPLGLKPFERFSLCHEKYVPGGRRLRTSLYLELTKLSPEISRTKVAIALAAALAPAEKVTMDGWCEFIMASDVISKRKTATWKERTSWIEKKTAEAEESLCKGLLPPSTEASVALSSGDLDRIFGDAPTDQRTVLPVETQLLLLIRLMTALVRVLLDKQNEAYAYRQTLDMALYAWRDEWVFYLKHGHFPATAGGSSPARGSPPAAAGSSATKKARCFLFACVAGHFSLLCWILSERLCCRLSERLREIWRKSFARLKGVL
jgi:hypothetical protein